ncbi:Leucine-rich repeats and immunoglobulin-like domains protein 2-like 2 [Homarus americanus]|uniref:Leucine-rich repeats and immunoglobulin-like domains protein 2-like 2 n=1 Tax=Homarus americanus TaxID=6706 RepID=A0A8J5N577_HOMAM|nr:Leucine-rich repeats and immunoglobulin-like domains protein 2-like 2 [Homarus americanus]
MVGLRAWAWVYQDEQGPPMTGVGVGRCSGAVLVVLLTLVLAGLARAACPHACVCKWKGGKQTVECVNKGLNTIPPGIDPGTQVMGLTNLQRIYVSRCKLVQLDDAAFRGLTNLVELDLSNNELTLVPAAALEHLPGLMRLQMSNNPITKIKNGAFRGLKYLTTLEMTSCLVQTMEPRAFQGLDQLEWLKMDSNQLKSVPLNMMLPKSLHGIDLHNNPWNCDCHLQELRTWLVKYNVPSSIEPKCSTPPRLEGQVIKNVHPDKFACAPEVRPTSLYLDVMEGKNVSFECHVTAEPSARIYWKYNEQSLENSSFVYDESSSFYIFEDSGPSEERISHLRIEWVTDAHAGVFQCLAENQAGLVVSNFTLRISQPVIEREPENFVMDHIVYIGVALVSLVVLVFILLCVLIFRCCRRRSAAQEKVTGSPSSSGNGRTKEAPVPSTNNMPKYIQMGTPAPKVNGINTEPAPISVIDTSPYRSEPAGAQQTNPDLISDAAEDRGKSGKKRVSILGVEEVDACGARTTRKLDDIMEEYEEGYDPTYDHLQSQSDQECRSSRNNPYATLPRRREMEVANPYPLTEIPPPEEMNQGSRFYDRDGFPIDYGLPRNGNGTWKEVGAGAGLSSSYNPLPTEEIPLYATVRRNRHSMTARTDLMHDQKYPEEYLLHSHDPQFQLPDGRYPQAYGLSSDKFNVLNNGSCEFCPPPPHPDFQADPGGRIGGDGCSFDNLLSSCGGSHCCYTEQVARVYDNSLPENYRPLDPEPPPPEGWGDHDEETVNMSTWCEHPESPGTRVLYSPDEAYSDQQQPQGTQV